MPGRVVIVAGPPGAGKTTVARLLADVGRQTVHLHTDDFWSYLRQGAVPPYLPEAHQQNTVVIGVLARAAFGYAAGGYEVFCDGVLGPWFLAAFRATAGEIPLHYVVLRPDEPTTLSRATGRIHEGALTDPGPIRAMYRQFLDLGRLESHVLDSTALDVAETARVARRGLAGDRFRVLPG